MSERGQQSQYLEQAIAHAPWSKRKFLQAGERDQEVEAVVCYGRIGDIQCLESGQMAYDFQGAVGNASPPQVEPLQMFPVLDGRHALIGNQFGIVEVQIIDSRRS